MWGADSARRVIMKKCLAIGCALVWMTSAGRAAEPESAATSKTLVSAGELQGFVVPNKSEFAIGEPVFLKLIFANWSKGSLFEIEGYLHPANDFEITIARPRELPVRYTGGVRKDVLYPLTRLRLRPREMSALRWTLCLEPDHPSGFLFEQPGEYTINCQVRTLVNQVPLVMPFPPLQITIKPATGEEQKALDVMLRPEIAEDLRRLQVRDETVKIWEDAAKRYSKSFWASYARMFLARRQMEGPPESAAAAAAQFEGILRDYPDFPLADDVYYLCASCQERQGKPIDTLRWLFRLEREFPTSSYIQPAGLFRRYIYQEGWERRYSPWYLRE